MDTNNRNQCDGCQAGHPTRVSTANRSDHRAILMHYLPDDPRQNAYMVCEKETYESTE